MIGAELRLETVGAISLLENIDEETTLLADKGYDSDAIRELLTSQAGLAQHPGTSQPQARARFSGRFYRQSNLVERFFNRITQFPGIATRYDKHRGNYLAAVKLVATRI